MINATKWLILAVAVITSCTPIRKEFGGLRVYEQNGRVCFSIDDNPLTATGNARLKDIEVLGDTGVIWRVIFLDTPVIMPAQCVEYAMGFGEFRVEVPGSSLRAGEVYRAVIGASMNEYPHEPQAYAARFCISQNPHAAEKIKNLKYIDGQGWNDVICRQ